METLSCINHVVNYIEENIDQHLEIEDIAREALLSKYYLQRIFHVLTGITLAEYIRNRKLSLAAEALASGEKLVTEVATQYDYDSTDAFTKAFKRLHGVTPSAVKKGEVRMKSFPKLSLQVEVIGRCEMNYRIVEKEAWDYCGLVLEATSKNGVEKEVEAFCDQVWMDGSHHEFNAFLGYPIMHMLDGIHFDFKEDGNRKYMLGWEVPQKEIPKAYKRLHIPAHMWVVFEHRADMSNKVAINELWKRIYMEWMPSAHFEQVEGPCIERFFWEDEDYYKYRCEVWLPVKRK